jgi:hypothetical protein
VKSATGGITIFPYNSTVSLAVLPATKGTTRNASSKTSESTINNRALMESPDPVFSNVIEWNSGI